MGLKRLHIFQKITLNLTSLNFNFPSWTTDKTNWPGKNRGWGSNKGLRSHASHAGYCWFQKYKIRNVRFLFCFVLFFLYVSGPVWINLVPVTSAQVWSNITEQDERWRYRYCMTSLEAALASSITMSQCYWTVWSKCHVVKRQHDSLFYRCYETDIKLMTDADIKLFYFFLFA